MLRPQNHVLFTHRGACSWELGVQLQSLQTEMCIMEQKKLMLYKIYPEVFRLIPFILP